MNIDSRPWGNLSSGETAILLTLVTCGIYGIYWIVCMTKEAVSVKDSADNALLEIILMLFLPFVGIFMTEKKFAEGCAARGVAHTDNSILYLVLGLVGLGIVGMCMLQNDLNKITTSAV